MPDSSAPRRAKWVYMDDLERFEREFDQLERQVSALKGQLAFTAKAAVEAKEDARLLRDLATETIGMLCVFGRNYDGSSEYWVKVKAFEDRLDPRNEQGI
jgi:hypothetical protein